MASRNGSEAYDFALFEPKRQPSNQVEEKANIIELPKEKLEENRRPKIKPLKMIGIIFTFVILASLAGTYVYGQVQLTELTDSVNSAAKIIAEDQNAYTQLKMKSDSQLSVETVETYASQKLGMKKIDNSQIEPIELSKGDKIQVLQKDKQENWLTEIWNSIKNLL